MAFTRDEIKSYESATSIVVDDTALPVPNVEPVSEPVVAETETEPTDIGTNDGSSTETHTAESVTATNVNPEDENTPELESTNNNDGRSRSRAQERIEELVAERNALREYGKYLLKQVESGRPLVSKETQDSQPVPAAPKVEIAPTLEDAGFDPVKLSQMQNEWIDKQVDKRVERAVQGLETRQNALNVQRTFESRSAEFRKTTPDYDLVMANPELPPLHHDAVAAVFKSENGPAIAYHLGKNPDVATRIARMDPYSQGVAIGRIEEQLARTKTEPTIMQNQEPSKIDTTTKVTKPASVSKAPPPPKPVSGGSAPVSRDSALMSMEEFVANERSRKLASRQERQKFRSALR